MRSPAARRRLIVTVLAAALLGSGPVALADEAPTVVRVHGVERQELDALAGVVDLWHVDPETGAATAAVDADGLAWLRGAGFDVEVDAERSARLRKLVARAPWPRVEGAGGIPGFPCYRTVDETLATARQLADEYPRLATVVDLGDSWEKLAGLGGDDLLLLRLTHADAPAPPGGKPRLMVIGGTHAREYTPVEVVTRFAEAMLAGWGVDPDATWILDHHELHLLLLANPDGRRRAETGLLWRKNADDDFCTGTDDRGIDLNRNYTFQWGCCGGSSSTPCSQIFRGPSAASEPETQAIVDHALAIFPDQRGDGLGDPAPADATGILVDIHSYGEDVLWSWGFTTTQPPNGTALYTLGRKIAWFTGYRPQHGSLSTVDGSTKDFAYGELGVPGFTFELGNAFFESCGAFESTIAPDNRAVLRYLAKVPRTPYLTPAGPDVVGVDLGGLGDVGLAAVGSAVALAATVDDTRYSTANGVEPSQPIAAAEVWIGAPPWADPPGLPVALAAADGAFDETVEDVAGALDTSGLAPGRHQLFLRGRDAAGNDGAVTGAFLYLVDPVASPLIRGRLLDAVSGEPLAGEVRLGPFRLPVAADGLYALRLPAGTWDLEATAPGHGPARFDAVAAGPGQTVVRSFALVPYTPVFADDVESGAGGWSAETPWAISEESAHSPTHAWSDSPGGDYGDNADVELVSPAMAVAGGVEARLAFWHTHELEDGFDHGIVEVSVDGGAWTEVARYTGTAPWRREEIPLPMADGAASVRARLRLDSDVTITRDGWHLDDVELSALPASAAGLLFADGFEAGDTAAWSSGGD